MSAAIPSAPAVPPVETAVHDAPLTIAGRSFRSRLVLGTGKYASFELMRSCHLASECDMVTVATRRVELDRTKASLLDFVDAKKLFLLPNTAGCYTAEDAGR